MKIMRPTSKQLMLRLQSAWSRVSSGGIFVAAGLCMIATFGKVTTLTCNRTGLAGSCELAASGLLGSEAKKIPLKILQGAKVDSDDGTYRVVVLTSTDEVPFTSYLSSGVDGKQAIASRINDFVKNPTQIYLIVQQDDRLWIYFFGGIFITVGLCTIANLNELNQRRRLKPLTSKYRILDK